MKHTASTAKTPGGADLSPPAKPAQPLALPSAAADVVKYQRKKEFVSRNIAGETVVIPVSGDTAILEKVFGLDETAAFLWDELKTAVPFNLLVDRLTATYEVDADTAKKDIKSFLGQMLKLGLIEKAKALK